MKAMILAAGRGERMRPLTDQQPKPMLCVGDKPLIQFHIEALKNAGIEDIVINLSYKGSMIQQYLQDGNQFGVTIQYSQEPNPAFETGGGIYNALPLLGPDAFVVVNADIYCDYDFTALVDMQPQLAHLILVPNPQHHPQGDFVLSGNDVKEEGGQKYTFSGIGVYQAALFNDCEEGSYPLAPLLRQAMKKGKVSGELFTGHWSDVGTPDRLKQVDEYIKGSVRG